MIWNIILEEIEKEIPENEFKRYIKNLEFDDKNSKSDLKILLTDNIYLSNWIKRNYLEKIALAFKTHTETKPQIEIQLKLKIKTTKSKTKYGYRIIENNQKNSILNPSCTFESFVVGESNKFAFNISEKISQTQGSIYNPLFISGETGLGKTHLLNAIGNYNIDKKNIILVTSEEFVNDFTNHLRNKNMDRFREKYRNCDYLLIDDIQFISGMQKIQDEFFYTFNQLMINNKQIVLTSDKPIKELNGIEDRLKSRFSSGIIAQIHPPELETKIAIIKKKCELDAIQLDNEIINFIASNVNKNVREIEGILMNINCFASVMNQEITLNFVKAVLENYKKTNKKSITIEEIIEMTSKILNIKTSEILNKTKTKNIIFAKKIIIYLARKLTTNSTPELAKTLGMKDHSSISKAMKKILKDIEIDMNLKTKIDEIENKIKELKDK